MIKLKYCLRGPNAISLITLKIVYGSIPSSYGSIPSAWIPVHDSLTLDTLQGSSSLCYWKSIIFFLNRDYTAEKIQIL